MRASSRAGGSRSRRNALLAAGLLGASGVAAGAFGAHALADTLSPRAIALWDIAVRYQMWHALALLGVAAAGTLWRVHHGRWVCRCWSAGIVVFSGSLYALALTGIGLLGAVTPLGGLALIGGWLVLLRGAFVAFRET